MIKENMPFHGVRVLDLSRLLPGSFCSMLLADFGADVIKIEDPLVGDYIRWWAPFVGKQSGYHIILNRNKRSFSLNLKSQKGKEIFKSLVRKVDVVIESFRPGVMEKLGLTYETLAKENEKLIYCAITGYGQKGPRARRAGHDINYLALSGILSYSGKDGEPVLPGVQIGDLGGGALLASFGIAMALYQREKTGKGDFIDVAMTDGLMLWHCLRWGKFIADGKVPEPADDMLNHGLACYNLYKTKDGRYMSLGALEPQFWKLFCEAVNHPEWNNQGYFLPGEHQKTLIKSIAEIFASRTQREWEIFFDRVDCCCEPVRNLAEVLNDREMEERGLIVNLFHEMYGAYKQMGIALRCRNGSASIRLQAPQLGEHTREILESEIGLTKQEVEVLKQEKVI